jgi:hypothetical protein
MSKILAPIAKLTSREPKVSGSGMPDRNKETHSPTANCYATIPSGNNVKATVDKVLNKIK